MRAGFLALVAVAYAAEVDDTCDVRLGGIISYLSPYFALFCI